MAHPGPNAGGRGRAPDLDPQARAFLEERARSGAPPVRDCTPEQARAGHLAQAQAVAGPQIPVSAVEDHEVATDDGVAIPVRVYREGDAGPVVVYIHGGGWVVGTLDTYDALCRAIVSRTGGTLVSVGYRLAPENPYPVALRDCSAALLWSSQQEGAGSLLRRLFVAGDSAGGNLAAVLARRARPRQVGLAGQVLVYPVTDPSLELPSADENAEGFALGTEDMRWYWSQYLAGAGATTDDPDLAPLRAPLPDLVGLPPALVLTAGYDPLRDEGEAYADRLEAADVEVERIRFPAQIHGFVRQLTVMDAAAEALDAVADFVRRRSA